MPTALEQLWNGRALVEGFIAHFRHLPPHFALQNRCKTKRLACVNGRLPVSELAGKWRNYATHRRR
jgi:hypothetical protein